jgi:hypothetical protein
MDASDIFLQGGNETLYDKGILPNFRLSREKGWAISMFRNMQGAKRNPALLGAINDLYVYANIKTGVLVQCCFP